MLQKLTYLVVIFGLLPFMILMGLGMSPRIDTLLPGWVDFFGGRQSMRTLHFITANLILLFLLIDLFEVVITGLWNNVRSMITGRDYESHARCRRCDSQFKYRDGRAMKQPTPRRMRDSAFRSPINDRRNFILRFAAGATALLLAGCDKVSQSGSGPKVLGVEEVANRAAQRALTPKTALAQEFTEADLSPTFRSNGTDNPEDEAYQRHARAQFRDWKLRVDGLVRVPTEFSLADLRVMKGRTQITRHDCIEGWSAIAKWTGVPLSEILQGCRAYTRRALCGLPLR